MSTGTQPPSSPTADLARLRLDRDRPRRVARRRHWPIFATSAVAAAAAFIFLSGDALPFRRVAVDVVMTRATETGGAASAAGTPVLSASGYVVARVRAAVAPEITGRLVELNVDVGSKVRRGQLLGRLADEDLIAREQEAAATIVSSEAALAEARTVRDDLRREAERQRDLLAQGLTSQAKHDAALAAADAADARVTTAGGRLETARASLGVVNAQLEKMRIRAPFAGTVLEKNAELGEVVGPAFGSSGGGAPVVTMADLGSVEVEVDVNEAYIQRVSPGMPAQIVLDAYPDRSYAGAVRQIVPTADRQRATVQVKVRFDAADERVLPEMGARVSFLAPASAGPDAERSVQVWIPSAAVRRVEGATVVYIVRGDRIVQESVEVGPPAGADVQVLNGLGPGERVVVGETDVKPGQRVRTREEDGT